MAQLEVGLGGVLGAHGRRARRVTAPGSLVVSAFRWSGLDRWTQRWWPQGIAVGDSDGVPLAIVSWFSTVRRRRDLGARVTVVDLERLRYHHVYLVEGPDLTPVSVHAGGIVWSGDRLLVAATMDGVREFRLSGILRRGGVAYWCWSRRRFVLPQVTRLEPSEKFRYSFIAEGTHGIATGEFATTEDGRLAGVTVGANAVSVADVHTPAIAQMQGAVVIDGVWAVTSSRGDRHNGDLWTGKKGALARHEGALPPGPEDLAWWPERRQLWGATENPAKRWVYAVDWPVSP